jgi:1-deoxy-D-xylulose-5-phosphate synthase
MLKFALKHTGPISIRYPKTNLEKVERSEDGAPLGAAAQRGASPRQAASSIELGKAEVIEWGEDGCFVAFGTLLSNCVAAAKRLKAEGIHMGVINARFVKPLDKETILRAVETLPLVVTVEEGTVEGGFGSAVLEAANAAGLDARNVVRRGIPDRFIEHGERNELLADCGLSVEELVELVRSSRTAEETAKCG